jgi:hypothetical protein
VKRLGRSKSVSGRSFIEDCKDRNITKRRRLRWLRRAGLALSVIRGGDPKGLCIASTVLFAL